MEFDHKPVLLEETIEGLRIKPQGTYVDGTLGGGGHSLRILERLNDQGRLIGIDQDEAAVAAAGERLERFTNVTIVRNNYCNIKQVLDDLGTVFHLVLVEERRKARGVCLRVGSKSVCKACCRRAAAGLIVDTGEQERKC